jgi:16S rRNA (cytosine1402-N4)-methyltransferase
MRETYHIPAMLKETIEGLDIKPEGVYVDVTFGGGGHSRAILENLSPTLPPREGEKDSLSTGEGGRLQSAKYKQQGHLYSFDQDVDALINVQREELQGEDEKRDEVQGRKELFLDNPQWTFVHSNFRYLKNWMDYYGVEEIDGLLADLGVSFHHFDCPERGFSFRYSAPLDMRMNQTAKRTAADIVNGYSEEELAKIFYLYGELKNGRQIARNICQARSRQPILRTEELVKSLSPSLSLKEGGWRDGEEIEVAPQYKKDLAKLFQALRIEVNDELGALREMLVAARDLLKPGGRIAILTYHSLEDRLVKNFLRSGNLEGTIEKDFYGNNLSPFRLIEKGREASEEEVERNPRARSAKLRVAEKLRIKN